MGEGNQDQEPKPPKLPKTLEKHYEVSKQTTKLIRMAMNALGIPEGQQILTAHIGSGASIEGLHSIFEQPDIFQLFIDNDYSEIVYYIPDVLNNHPELLSIFHSKAQCKQVGGEEPEAYTVKEGWPSEVNLAIFRFPNRDLVDAGVDIGAELYNHAADTFGVIIISDNSEWLNQLANNLLTGFSQSAQQNDVQALHMFDRKTKLPLSYWGPHHAAANLNMIITKPL